MKSKRRFSLSRLFRNNKFVLVISLIISVTIWVLISLSNTNESDTTINNIPIQINLSDEAVKNGLKIFSGDDQTASVLVKGNRVTLGSITSDDIIVSAQTAGTISTPGTYALSLTAKKSMINSNFEIASSVSPSVITVFVDHSKTSTFKIENKLKYNVMKGYHAEVTLSPDEVKVKGPQSEVSKIAYAAIEGTIGGEISEDKSSEFDIKLFDSTDTEISNGMFDLSDTTVMANFSVLPEKEVPVKPEYKNKPSSLDINSFVDINPSKILISAPKSTLNNISYIPTEQIDFNELPNKKNTLSVNLNMPDKVSNLSENKSIKATIDLRSYKSKRLSITNDKFKLTGLDDKYAFYFLTDELTVTVNGPKSKVKKITPADVSCEIDASDIDGTTGSISLPVKVSVKQSDYCWVYGEYKANVYVYQE